MKERDFCKYLRRTPRIPKPPPELAAFPEAVVIPAYDEEEELPATLASLAAAGDGDVAVIVVVNYPAGTDPESSRRLFERLSNEPLYENRRLFPVYAPELTGGVGEARRLGMDMFIASRTPESVEQGIIFSLDADSRVAPDYFRRVRAELAANPAAPGVLIAVSHRAAPSPAQEAAIRRYERYLQRYADSLHRAGSPYDFIAIGSGFAVRAAACIRAGGMKRRRAGEDFYFLQELAKLGTLARISDPLVFPSPRSSARVPFGTGPAVSALLAGEELPEISDHAFAMLGRVIAAATAPEGLAGEAKNFRSSLDRVAVDFFERERFFQLWPEIAANQPDTREAKLRAFHRWFDGLKTLRFLHAVDAVGNSGSGAPSSRETPLK